MLTLYRCSEITVIWAMYIIHCSAHENGQLLLLFLNFSRSYYYTIIGIIGKR